MLSALIRFFLIMEFTFMYFELFNTLMYADYGSVRLVSMSPRNRKYRVAMDTVSTVVLWWETTFNKPLFVLLFIYNTYQEMSEICVIFICVLNSSLLILGLKKEERKKKTQSWGINIVNENVLHNEKKLHLTLVKMTKIKKEILQDQFNPLNQFSCCIC